MDLKGFIEDVLTQERAGLLEVIDDLTPEELAWRPGPEANHIGWMLWHMFRAEDMWIQFFIQNRNEIWERDGWHERFGLPTRDNGFGHTAEQVAGFPALDQQELLEYGRAVREQTLEYLRGLEPEDFELSPQGKASRHVSQNSVPTADGGVPPAPGAGSLSQGTAAAGASHSLT